MKKILEDIAIVTYLVLCYKLFLGMNGDLCEEDPRGHCHCNSFIFYLVSYA